MTYQVLARKWRPHSFAELVGQEHVVRALTNALDQQRLHHAYLFTGTRGVGKTTLGRILAKCLNCEQGVSSTPCNQCTACTTIDAGRFVDLIEVDAASRTKVEDTRELLDNVQYAPSMGRYKIFLIDEVHMLSGHSFNALLKTLEEPPEHVKFLLATTDPQRLPVTVLSRCLQFHLKNLTPEQIQQQLAYVLTQEKISAEAAALNQLAIAANGSMRDGLSLLDQAIAYGNGEVKQADVSTMLGTVELQHLHALVDALATLDANAMVNTIQILAELGADFNSVLNELASLIHQISVQQFVPNNEKLQPWAKQFDKEQLQLFYQIAIIGGRDLPLAPTAKSGFEMVMLRMLAFTPNQTPAGQNTAKKTQAAKPTKTEIKPPSSTDNWPELLTQLNLIGPTRALAEHCELEKVEDNSLYLLLAKSHAPLLNAKHEQRISDALTTHFGQATKAVINTSTKSLETPAKITQQQQADRHASAQQSLEKDSNVQAIISAFDAKIQNVTN